MRFSRDMRRHGESLADSFLPGEIEDAPVRGREREHFGKLRPGEADAGQIACAVHRVDRAEALQVEPFGPSGGIIVNADGAARTAHVDMVREREIAKTKVLRDRADRLGKIVFTGKFADVFDEFFYAIEHPPHAAFRNAA